MTRNSSLCNTLSSCLLYVQGCQSFTQLVNFGRRSVRRFMLTSRMRCSSQMYTYISSECISLSHSPTVLRGISSISTTPSRSKNCPQVQPYVYALAHPPYYATLNRAWLDRATNCVRGAKRRLASTCCIPLLPCHPRHAADIVGGI